MVHTCRPVDNQVILAPMVFSSHRVLTSSYPGPSQAGLEGIYACIGWKRMLVTMVSQHNYVLLERKGPGLDG